MNKSVFFAMTVRKYLKLEIKISKAKENKNKLVRLVFGRIYGAPICLWFYLTFNRFHFLNGISLPLNYSLVYLASVEFKTEAWIQQ